MKGIVFTEFLEMVENAYGFEVADNIVNNSQLESGGVYSAVGTYNHSEMVQLVTNLSQEVETPIEDLLGVYGNYFFKILMASYPQFFEGVKSAYQFLSGIESYIHVEVLKLYPDAELPHFEIESPNDNTLIMTYHSERKLHAFAEGLINGCIEHFKEEIKVSKALVKEDGSVVKFTLIKG